MSWLKTLIIETDYTTMVDLNLTLEDIAQYDWMNLEEGEEIQLRAHPSIIPHLPQIGIGLIAILAGFVIPIFYWVDFLPQELKYKAGFTIALFIFGSLMIISIYLRVKSTFFVFTDDKLVRKRHIFRIDTRETPYSKVQDFEYKQSIAQRILNIGIVSIWTAGSSGKEFQMNDVPNPKKANKILSDYT